MKRSSRTYNSEKNQKGPLRGNLKIYCGIMFICFLLILTGFYYMQYYQLKQQLKANNEEMIKIQEENKNLEKEVLRLQDDEYIEFLARKHLGLSRIEDDFINSESGEDSN